MLQANDASAVPSHICPNCGEWWDVQRDGCDTWLLATHDYDAGLTATVWRVASCVPICPIDGYSLQVFCIDDG